MALEVSKAALEAGFEELRTFSSMVDFAPRDEVDSALQKVFVAMYDKMFPATLLPNRRLTATKPRHSLSVTWQ